LGKDWLQVKLDFQTPPTLKSVWTAGRNFFGVGDTEVSQPRRTVDQLALAASDPTQTLARRFDIRKISRFLRIGQRASYVPEIVSTARALSGIGRR
jgi:hypothetical protein